MIVAHRGLKVKVKIMSQANVVSLTSIEGSFYRMSYAVHGICHGHVSVCVCLCVYPSEVRVLLKWLYIGTRK